MSDTEDERDFYQKCYEEKIDECERLQKQLYIALTGLKTIKSMEFERYLMANGWRAVNQMRETAKIYIKRVEELNK